MVVNGWALLQHDLFAEELDTLITKVEALAAKESETYRSHPSTNLATIKDYMLKQIPGTVALRNFGKETHPARPTATGSAPSSTGVITCSSDFPQRKRSSSTSGTSRSESEDLTAADTIRKRPAD